MHDDIRCPSCAHLLAAECPCPEDCPALAEAETARLADLARFFDGHQPLNAPADPFAMFEEAATT